MRAPAACSSSSLHTSFAYQDYPLFPLPALAGPALSPYSGTHPSAGHTASSLLPLSWDLRCRAPSTRSYAFLDQ